MSRPNHMSIRSNMTDYGILGHDPETTRPLLGSFIRFLRWASLAYLGCSWIIHSGWTLAPFLGAGSVFLGSFALQRLLERNHLRATSWAILASIYLALLPGLVLRGTLSSSGILVLSSIPLAALLLGMKSGIVYAVLNAATFLCIAFCERNGWTHPSGAGANLASWALSILIAAWSVVAYQAIPIRGIVSALRMANTERNNLETVIARQEKENVELETKVDQRTEGLRCANENATRLTAYLSHDLHAPLRTVRGFAKILSDEQIPDSVKVQLQGILSDVESLELILEKTMQNLRRENRS